MTLTKDEQAQLNALGANKKNFEIIYKFFIRPFETMPLAYKDVPNEQLGEIIKGQMLARENNIKYLMEMKSAVEGEDKVATPIAPS